MELDFKEIMLQWNIQTQPPSCLVATEFLVAEVPKDAPAIPAMPGDNGMSE
jgi:hypothetical protein